MRPQTIPDEVLEKIAAHRPHLASIIRNMRAGRVPAPQAEKALGDAYLLGETRLSGPETYALSACCTGHAYGEHVAR